MKEAIAPIVIRQNNAYDRGVEIIMEAGNVSREDATKVVNLYLKEKIAKLDIGVAQFKVKHGAFLEADVIARAVEA